MEREEIKREIIYLNGLLNNLTLTRSEKKLIREEISKLIKKLIG
jgi:hypothetical protein